jgi:hypothetical protein
LQPVEKLLLCETMEKHGQCRIVAGGFSMFPLIRDGDVVGIERRSREHLGPGDIIAFFLNDNLCIHRVVRWDGKPLGACTVRGDAFRDSLYAVPPADILGLAVWRDHAGTRRKLATPIRNRLAARFSLPHFIYSFIRLKLKF